MWSTVHRLVAELLRVDSMQQCLARYLRCTVGDLYLDDIVVIMPHHSADEQTRHRDHNIGPQKSCTVIISTDAARVLTASFYKGSHVWPKSASITWPEGANDAASLPAHAVILDGHIFHFGSAPSIHNATAGGGRPEWVGQERLFVVVSGKMTVQERKSNIRDQHLDAAARQLLAPWLRTVSERAPPYITEMSVALGKKPSKRRRTY